MSMPVIVPHAPSCRWKGEAHTDAAKRISDYTYLHKVAAGADAAGKFIACRLDDGRGGETLYDTHFDAVRHHPSDHMLYCYLRLRYEGMSVCDAELYLYVNRQAYDNGFRLTDPDDPKQNRTLIPRVDPQHQLKTLQGLRRK